MTAIPLSAEDEAAAQLIVGRIIGRTKTMQNLEVRADELRRELVTFMGLDPMSQSLTFNPPILAAMEAVRREVLEEAANSADQMIVGRVKALKAEIKLLRAALNPLALVGELIDGRSVGGVRPDNATIWQANAQHESAFDLTMAHARAARTALEEE